jgi:putative zinc finger/helix-turn-helix YgiT family protein
MKCLQCGSPMVSRRENHKYDDSGLPGITLVNVEVRRCRNCGEYEVVIPRIESLHRLIALALTRKPARLAPTEIRFLRKYLGWSGTDFAAHIGATTETVSRWEQGHAAMGVQADRLLRLMVAHKEPASDYSLDVLKDVARERPRPLRLGVTVTKGDWREAA